MTQGNDLGIPDHSTNQHRNGRHSIFILPTVLSTSYFLNFVLVDCQDVHLTLCWLESFFPPFLLLFISAH